MGSLKHQLINAIDSAFGEGGHDKHSAKSSEGTGSTIYSYKERENLKDVGTQLVNYAKTEFGVKQIKDISNAMVKGFLESKASTCRQSTIDNYTSRLCKLGNIVNRCYKSANVVWKVKAPESRVGAEKLRRIKMDKEDFKRVIDYAKLTDSKSKAPVALELAGKYGLRVAELSKMLAIDVDLGKLRLHIHESKGGKSRDLKILEEDREFFKKLIIGKSGEDKLIEIKENSINKWLSRNLKEKLGIDKYKDCKTGVHSIRKMAATNRYLDNIKSGLSKKEAEKEVSVWLGHGEDRKDVIINYIVLG